VTDDEIPEPLEQLLAAIEMQSETMREMLDVMKLLRERVDELQEGEADLHVQLDRHARRARLLYSMKAITLTSTCQRCGTEFAREPGPMLCGPCWCELGKPERYLAPTT